MLRMSNTEIKERIEAKLLSLTTQDSLACILVFESLASEPTQLRSTLCTLEGLLGSNFKQSVIVVLTKADVVMDEEELAGSKKTAEVICKDFGMQFMYWANNHHQFTIDEGVFRQQVGELKKKIDSVSRYSMQGVKNYHQRIADRARALELTTPKQTRTEQFEVVAMEYQHYTEAVTKYRTAYRERSKRRGGIAGAFGGRKTYLEQYTESYIEHEPRVREVEVRRLENRQVEIPFGPGHFTNIAKNEMLQELRNKYRQI